MVRFPEEGLTNAVDVGVYHGDRKRGELLGKARGLFEVEACHVDVPSLV